MSDRDKLLEFINTLAVVRGRVVLSGGQVADSYVDLRRVVMHHGAAPLVGRVMNELTSDLRFDAVGGLTLGADPVATAMMHTSSRRVNAFVVRKTEKIHGLSRRIEGPDVAGKQVLAVEDTSTTGSSVLTAVDALRDAGAEPIAVAVIVDRGAGPAVEKAGLEYRAAYTLNDLQL